MKTKEKGLTFYVNKTACYGSECINLYFISETGKEKEINLRVNRDGARVDYSYKEIDSSYDSIQKRIDFDEKRAQDNNYKYTYKKLS